jgi:hypothetical protein
MLMQYIELESLRLNFLLTVATLGIIFTPDGTLWNESSFLRKHEKAAKEARPKVAWDYNRGEGACESKWV